MAECYEALKQEYGWETAEELPSAVEDCSVSLLQATNIIMTMRTVRIKANILFILSSFLGPSISGQLKKLLLYFYIIITFLSRYYYDIVIYIKGHNTVPIIKTKKRFLIQIPFFGQFSHIQNEIPIQTKYSCTASSCRFSL